MDRETRGGVGTACGLLGLVLVGVVLSTPWARAASIDSIQVSHGGSVYDVQARLTIDAPRKQAYGAATDFEALADKARLIVSSRRIASHRLDSVLSMCVLFYCRDIRQVMDYRLSPSRAISMTVVPGAGDLKSGQAHWQFESHGPAQTVLCFKAHIVPDFWVPPMIGDWALRRALRAQMLDTAQAVESLARAGDNTGRQDSATAACR